jgi:hypothetical protein
MYSFWFILLGTNIDVPRHILIIDISILMASNMELIQETKVAMVSHSSNAVLSFNKFLHILCFIKKQNRRGRILPTASQTSKIEYGLRPPRSPDGRTAASQTWSGKLMHGTMKKKKIRGHQLPVGWPCRQVLAAYQPDVQLTTRQGWLPSTPRQVKVKV